MMLMFLLMDPPFNPEFDLSGRDVSSCTIDEEVTMAKQGNTILVAYISEEYNANVLMMSFDGGNSWSSIGYGPSYTDCWVGDPAVAIQPDNPNKIYFAGIEYCQGSGGQNDVRGEVWFCTCSAGAGCSSASNWSCTYVGQNDYWTYFKDKEWLLPLGGSTVLVNFTSNMYGDNNLFVYKTTDDGATWNGIGYLNFISTVGYWAKDGNTIYMSFNDFSNVESNYEIGAGFLYSTDGGNSFNLGGEVFFSIAGSQSTACPHDARPAKIHDHITASSGKVAIAFTDDYCLVNVATWQGTTPLGVQQVSPDMGGTEQILPMLASYGNYIYLMYQGRIGDYGYCGSSPVGEWATGWLFSPDWGNTWSQPYRVSSRNYGFRENPSGHDYLGWFIDDGILYAAWGNDFFDEDGGHVLFAYSNPVELAEFSQGKIPFAVFIMPGGIMINSREQVEIFSASGRLIRSMPPGEAFVPLKSGIYILHSGSYSKKVIVQ